METNLKIKSFKAIIISLWKIFIAVVFFLTNKESFKWIYFGLEYS